MSGIVIAFRSRSDKKPFRGKECLDIEPSDVKEEVDIPTDYSEPIDSIREAMVRNQENESRLKKEREKDNNMVFKTYRIK